MRDEQVKEIIKGQSILDRDIFEKKIDFFYKSTDEIIYQGDLRDKFQYYQIFKEFSKKAKMNTNAIKTNSNKSKPHTSNGNNNSNGNSNSKRKTRNKSNPLIAFNSKDSTNALKSITHSIKNISPFSTQANPKVPEASIGLLKKSQSSTYKSNSAIGKQINFIKGLDDKLTQLDGEIHKSRNEPVLKLPSSLVNSESRIINLYMDYFEPNQCKQIKTRHKNVYNDEDYFKQSKVIQHSKSYIKKTKASTPLMTKKTKKNCYIRVMNDGLFKNSREIVRNKYDTIGIAKILNIPKEFYNDEEMVRSKNKGIEDNVTEMYSTITKSQRKLKRLTNRFYYSIENKKAKKPSKLLEINDEVNKVEKEGRKIKKSILDVKHFFNRKSPVVNIQMLAYVSDPLGLYMRNGKSK